MRPFVSAIATLVAMMALSTSAAFAGEINSVLIPCKPLRVAPA